MITKAVTTDVASIAQPEPSASPVHPSLVNRAVGVFGQPRRLFGSFGVDAPWLGPLVVSIAVGVLVIVALPDHVLYDGMQGATTRRGIPVEITSSPGIVAAFERVRLSMGVIAIQPVLAVMTAGALMLVFGRLMRWPAEFRQYFAVATHAFLISAAGAAFTLAMQIWTGSWGWEPSLGPLLAIGGGTAVPGAALVNPFTLWMLVVLGIGVASINERGSVALPVALLSVAYLGLAVLRGAVAG